MKGGQPAQILMWPVQPLLPGIVGYMGLLG